MLKNSSPASAWRRRLERGVDPNAMAVTQLSSADVEPARQSLRPAAVLIAVEETSTPQIYFTQRSRALTHHPGQIGFPGGRIETGDAGPADAALRECTEEIGLAREAVTLLGGLPQHRTATGFEIHPFVGWVESGQTLVPDGFEIEKIFTVPLGYAMDLGRYRRARHTRGGREYTGCSIEFDGHYIWGATAAMLMRLAQRVAAGTAASS